MTAVPTICSTLRDCPAGSMDAGFFLGPLRELFDFNMHNPEDRR
jgi:hypothetical protein